MYCFTFKENSDCRFQIGQVTNSTKKISNITSKTRNTLGNNKIYLVSLGIGNHLIESLALGCGCSRNSLIGINLIELPMWVLLNKVFVVFLLQLIRCCLPYIISRNSNIDANRLGDVIITIIKWLLFGDILIFTTVKPCINSVTNFLLCRGSVSLSVAIKHPITPSLVRHRRVFRVPRGRTPMSAYPLNNR